MADQIEKKYEILKFIGSGAYGDIYEVVRVKDNKMYAKFLNGYFRKIIIYFLIDF